MGKNQLVHWSINLVNEQNQPQPKYQRFGDMSVVFDLLKSWPSNRHSLGFKVAILFLLVTGHWGQAIVTLLLDQLTVDEATFELKTFLKSNRTGKALFSVHVSSSPNAVSGIRAYIPDEDRHLKTNCMGGLYNCIVACTYLGNSTGRRTATMMAPLLLTSGLAKYEVIFLVFLGACAKGWSGLNQINKREYVAHGGTSPVCGWGVCKVSWNRPSVCGGVSAGTDWDKLRLF